MTTETKAKHTPGPPVAIDRISAAYPCGCSATNGAITFCAEHAAAAELVEAVKANEDAWEFFANGGSLDTNSHYLHELRERNSAALKSARAKP